eukprot:349824-Chlamydomonas_euryale.AAC.10
MLCANGSSDFKRATSLGYHAASLLGSLLQPSCCHDAAASRVTVHLFWARRDIRYSRSQGLREEIVDDHYCLVLEFESKFDFAVWEAKEPKIASFFGPGIYTKIEKKEKGADVYLISDGSGNGITGIEKKDVLIPLLPGLKPRQQ